MGVEKMVRKVDYRDLKETLKINIWDDGSYKGKMQPSPSYVKKRPDQVIQYPKPYKENYEEVKRNGLGSINKYPYDKANNVGIKMGEVFVIDLDQHGMNKKTGQVENGIAEFQRWINKHTEEEQEQIEQDLKETMIVQTPRSGLHIYFLFPNYDSENVRYKQTTGANKGIDLMMTTWTPAPNSVRKDGMYKLANENKTEIMEVPQWALKFVDEICSKKSDDVSVGVQKGAFHEGGKGSYLNSNINKVINAMFDGFEEGTRNDGMTSLVGSLVWYVRNNKLTNHNARRIAMEAAKNSEPPMDIGELSTIWNSIVGRVNNLDND